LLKKQKIGDTRGTGCEHHNMPGIASSATVILIGHIAWNKNNTVDSGGIMLLITHLIVAEQFGTLATFS
jgi:alkanesulfonate monooxygenase SsuD/methylene tetrahydromethanopterin reductase-like flavin-dependent oxidoreductase (luciferase family)